MLRLLRHARKSVPVVFSVEHHCPMWLCPPRHWRGFNLALLACDPHFPLDISGVAHHSVVSLRLPWQVVVHDHGTMWLCLLRRMYSIHMAHFQHVTCVSLHSLLRFGRIRLRNEFLVNACGVLCAISHPFVTLPTLAHE